MPWSGCLVTTSDSGRDAGSVHGGAGRSIAWSACVVAFAASALQRGGATDSQSWVTPSTHGCQSTGPTDSAAVSGVATPPVASATVRTSRPAA